MIEPPNLNDKKSDEQIRRFLLCKGTPLEYNVSWSVHGQFFMEDIQSAAYQYVKSNRQAKRYAYISPLRSVVEPWRNFYKTDFLEPAADSRYPKHHLCSDTGRIYVV